jgi:dehydratase
MITLRKFLTPVVVLSLVLVPLPATASGAAVSYACRADTKFGQHQISLRQGAEAKAPATVKPGAHFYVVVDLKPGALPGEVKGFKLKEVRDLSLRIPIPANSQYVSAWLSGGSGLNSTPTIQAANGVATLRVAGPIAGGASYKLPQLTVHLKAGRSGVVETKLQGSSFDNPGLDLQATIKWKFVTIKSPVRCYPDPNPALTRTEIR